MEFLGFHKEELITTTIKLRLLAIAISRLKAFIILLIVAIKLELQQGFTNLAVTIRLN